jgi:calcineurin-like phosphoesterase family protein
MSRFFTSDLHIRHDLVVHERGFWYGNNEDGLVIAHDEYEARIAADWDSRVRKDDIVYVLGDIAMNPRKGAFQWLDARPGRKILINGNHDATAGFHSSAANSQREWLEHFESVHDYLQIKFGTRRVLLSHYPYVGEGGRDIEDRHTQFRLRDEGAPLLHGHEHKGNATDPTLPHQLHVGLDSWNLELVHELSVEDWLDMEYKNPYA